MISYWNYRVLVHLNDPLSHAKDDVVTLQIHEVQYNEADEPISYLGGATGTHGIKSENMEGLSWILDRMQEALTKPILWAGDDFPKIYRPIENEYQGDQSDPK